MRKMEILNTTSISRRSMAVCVAALFALGGCATADKLSKVGKAPEMSSIANPVTQDNYQPVSLPMPPPLKVAREKNSLWQSDRVTFFKDQRASNIGDIITVLIDIDDEAEIDNSSKRTRTGQEGAGLDALLGYEQALNRILPQAVDSSNLAQADSSSSYSGSGTIDREDKIEMRLAALVTQLLPNGNMVVHGKQEVLVNFEKRILAIDGVIRPEDISVENTVKYDQIAEARVVYGGEGHITDVQQPRYGQQIYDVIFPF